MARRSRVNIAGFHHIVNRGVDKSSVFKNNEDKDKFLEIVCKAAREYYVDIHDYCLMDNHYHLLAFFNRNNLSLFMRQINSNWAIYFNKKYTRNRGQVIIITLINKKVIIISRSHCPQWECIL